MTTVMLRNIPHKYGAHQLMEEIDSLGFFGRYNYFKLPRTVQGRSNSSYAFLNFLDASDAEAFLHIFHGRRFLAYRSSKCATVEYAFAQGLACNLQASLPEGFVGTDEHAAIARGG